MDIAVLKNGSTYYKIILPTKVEKVFSFCIPFIHAFLAHALFELLIRFADLCMDISHNNEKIMNWDIVLFAVAIFHETFLSFF